MDKTGLNSLKYSVVNTEKTYLYTKIFVHYTDNEEGEKKTTIPRELKKLYPYT